MSVQITRRLKPEEDEVLRKREELAAIRTALAELELELVDLRSQFAAFEGRYLREVGALYAELDEWKARIAELQARLAPSAATKEQAQQAREQAHQTHEEAHGKASETRDFKPSPDLKRLYREVAKLIHPDLAKDSTDLERRIRFMAEANRAYGVGDAEALQATINDYHYGADDLDVEGIGAELIRIIRQVSQAKDRVSAIEKEMVALRQSEISQLKRQADEIEQVGRDLLVELATSIREQIERTKNEYEALSKQDKPS